ncbi:MAG: hypothetical protein ACI8TX_000622 [Hyphomicrobiaceae bacterium]|jgi:hypothetical protein
MAWTFEEFYKSSEERFGSLFQGLRARAEGGPLSTLVQPVDPYNRSSILTPIVSAAALCGLVVCATVAVGAFSITLAALMAVYFLLTEIFGYELELMPFPGQPNA